MVAHGGKTPACRETLTKDAPIDMEYKRIKLLARPRLLLHQWSARQYHRLPMHLGLPPPAGNIERADGRTMCATEFRRRYELRYGCSRRVLVYSLSNPQVPRASRSVCSGRPVLIDGMCERQRCESWTPKQLAHDCGDWEALVGRGEGNRDKVRLRVDKYWAYCAADGRTDDSPLYVFDPQFGENPVAQRLVAEYQVPHFFSHDLFELAGSRRPPFRWFLMGPCRSGSGIHVDPLATSAWNTLAWGRKWWVLFPPCQSSKIVKPKKHMPDDTAISWFCCVLSRLIAAGVPRIEFIQQAGQTVFIPGGWHHVVINLDDTIAVTHNFCSPANFSAVWADVADHRPGLAAHWLHQLHLAADTKQPELRPLVQLAVQQLRALASQSHENLSATAEWEAVPKQTTVAAFLTRRKHRIEEMTRLRKLNRRVQRERGLTWGSNLAAEPVPTMETFRSASDARRK